MRINSVSALSISGTTDVFFERDFVDKAYYNGSEASLWRLYIALHNYTGKFKPPGRHMTGFHLFNLKKKETNDG